MYIRTLVFWPQIFIDKITYYKPENLRYIAH